MTTDTDAAAQQHDSQPDAPAGHPSPAGTDTDDAPASEVSDQDNPNDDQDDGGKSGNAEAARWRRKYRDEQARSAELENQLQALRQSVVDDIARAALPNPELLATEHELSEFVAEDGSIDRQAVADAAKAFAKKNGIRAFSGLAPNPQQGMRSGGGSPGSSSWASALKDS